MIKRLNAEDLVDGIEISNCDVLMSCSCCIKGKMVQTPFESSIIKTKKPLILVHRDVCGPMETKTVGGKRYLATFIDDYSRYTFTYLLEKKSEVLQKFKEFVALASNNFGQKLCILRTDNGGEYVGKEMEEYLKEEGIEHKLTVSYTPQQNGVAERKIGQ